MPTFSNIAIYFALIINWSETDARKTAFHIWWCSYVKLSIHWVQQKIRWHSELLIVHGFYHSEMIKLFDANDVDSTTKFRIDCDWAYYVLFIYIQINLIQNLWEKRRKPHTRAHYTIRLCGIFFKKYVNFCSVQINSIQFLNGLSFTCLFRIHAHFECVFFSGFIFVSPSHFEMFT